MIQICFISAVQSIKKPIPFAKLSTFEQCTLLQYDFEHLYAKIEPETFLRALIPSSTIDRHYAPWHKA